MAVININENVLSNTEKIIYSLRTLYRENGYSQYRMSKFEEYDLYSKNKDFLISDGIITFTDTNGKLLALKPDVTLSIIKNNKDLPNGLQQLCYDESVYRVSKSTGNFREITQAGLECLGNVDTDCIGNVLKLAAESLNTISDNFVLQISHLGIVDSFVDRLTDDKYLKSEIFKLIGEKNIHEIENLCIQNNLDEDITNDLKTLVSLYGSTEQILTTIKELSSKIDLSNSINQLESVISLLSSYGYSNNIRVDFSVTGNTNYYNGIIFKGFVNGIPESILSGGQYDNLMKKMGRKSKAIGFAVYVDLLNRLN